MIVLNPVFRKLFNPHHRFDLMQPDIEDDNVNLKRIREGRASQEGLRRHGLHPRDEAAMPPSGEARRGSTRGPISPVRCGSAACVLLATALTAAPVWAQETGDTREGRGYLMLGVTTIDLAPVNARLGPQGYPALPETLFTVGGGGHGVRGRWIIGGEGMALVGRSKEAPVGGVTFDTTLHGGYGFFDLGYLAFAQDGLHVYPLIGVGGGGGRLTFDSTADRSFDDLAANPRVGATALTGGFLMQVALGVDKLFVLGTRDEGGRRREGGVVVGVRAGYVFGPGQSNWGIGGTDVTGGPDLKLTGPYVRVVIGGGGRDMRP